MPYPWYGQAVNKKATFVLPAALLDEMRSMVDRGAAESVSALVRDSLEARLCELRDQILRREYEEASRDPLFLADQAECARDFEQVDLEGLS